MNLNDYILEERPELIDVINRVRGATHDDLRFIKDIVLNHDLKVIGNSNQHYYSERMLGLENEIIPTSRMINNFTIRFNRANQCITFYRLIRGGNNIRATDLELLEPKPIIFRKIRFINEIETRNKEIEKIRKKLVANIQKHETKIKSCRKVVAYMQQNNIDEMESEEIKKLINN